MTKQGTKPETTCNNNTTNMSEKYVPCKLYISTSYKDKLNKERKKIAK